MDPFFICDSAKSFEEACASLQQAAPDHGFGVLAVPDLGQTLPSKGLAFQEQCRIFEVCNPSLAAVAGEVEASTRAIIAAAAAGAGPEEGSTPAP
jgi:uncharacterized protein (DUF302 family)